MLSCSHSSHNYIRAIDVISVVKQMSGSTDHIDTNIKQVEYKADYKGWETVRNSHVPQKGRHRTKEDL